MKMFDHWFRLPGIVISGAVALICASFPLCFAVDAAEGDEFKDYQFPLSVILAEEPVPEKEGGEKRWYLGLGGFFGIPSDLDDVSVTAGDASGFIRYRFRIGPETDSGGGLGLKGGYFLSRDFALEALFRYHFRYKIKGDYSKTRQLEGLTDEVSADVEGDLKGWDFSVNLKYFILDGNIRPYAAAGLGYTGFKKKGDIEVNVVTTTAAGDRVDNPVAYDLSESTSGVLGRVGAGCDWFLTDRLGLELELDYSFGFDSVDEIRIIGIGLNALFFF